MSRRIPAFLLLALLCTGCCSAFREGKEHYNLAMRNRSFSSVYLEHAADSKQQLLRALAECSLNAEEKSQAHLLLVELYLAEGNWDGVVEHLDAARALGHPAILPEQDRAFFHVVQGEVQAHAAIAVFNAGATSQSPADLQAVLESCRRHLQSALLEFRTARGLSRSPRLKALATLRQAQTRLSFARTMEIGPASTMEVRYRTAIELLDEAFGTLENALLPPDAVDPANRLLTEIRAEQTLLRDRLQKEHE